MIDKLTPYQEKMIGEYYNKYLAYGLRTTPLDREKSFEVIDKLYQLNGKKKPMKFVFDSPMACLIAYCALKDLLPKINKELISGKQISSQIELQIRSQIRSQIGSQIESQIRSQIWSQISSQIESQISSQIWSKIESQIWSQIRSQIRSQIWSQIESQIGSQISSQIRSQISSQIESQIGSQIWSQIRSQISSQIESQIWSQIESQIDSQILEQLKDAMVTGNHWCGYLGYYQYFKDIFGFKLGNEELMNTLHGWVEELHWFLPYENMCIMSDHPIAIYRNANGLHADGKMALEYKDGYGIWSLNGVRVPEYLAKTPEGQLDIDFFTKETNADVKAEFIRKFGIDRMKHLGKRIDIHTNYSQEWWTKSEYELIDMAPIFTNIQTAPHLWMKNQTTGVYHLEAVHPVCNTIEKALKFRSRNRNITAYLTKEIR